MMSLAASGASRQSGTSQGGRVAHANPCARFAGGWRSTTRHASETGRIAGLLLAAVLAGVLHAAPTDLDWRWDGDGMVFPSDPATEYVEGMLLQFDGSLIIALSGSSNTVGVNRVVRLDPMARLDSSFGTNGRILLSFPGSGGLPEHAPKSLAMRPDGRFDVLWLHSRPLTPSVTACSRIWARYLPTG